MEKSGPLAKGYLSEVFPLAHTFLASGRKRGDSGYRHSATVGLPLIVSLWHAASDYSRSNSAMAGAAPGRTSRPGIRL